MDEVTEATPTATPRVVAPPAQFHSPSLTRSPLLSTDDRIEAVATKTQSPRPRFNITPIGSPIRRALNLTRLDPHDAWLPITESRNGNAFYAAFHTLCSGIGIQALVLPVAFTILGWQRAFKATGLLPYPLPIGGDWYLVFTCAAVLLAQLPNLNSIAGVSLIGAITAVGYCTLIWAISVVKGRLPGVSYDPIKPPAQLERAFAALNALGIVAFAFRGHNLILEIQGTMPSSEKHPSRVPMWRGVKFAYLLVAACLFPLAIGGYWVYGVRIPSNGGMLTALYAYHSRDTSQFLLGLTSLLVIINAVSSFQIYGMPMFDSIEACYTKRKKQACPWWLRVILRTVFSFICFFVAIAIPFLSSLAGLIGGIALPVTFAYPCFMWLKMKKPKKYGIVWWVNWVLGVLGMGLSFAMIAAGIYVVINTGIQASFFKPH
ncbi:lysine histidine transporter-like 8 [Cucumis melo var. makuwa]|uniref:Lysine histidine transporter-like 8 n=1 Tax=Cucumis melo var. makuwa TaxID=1194695 RepID=A0A5D3DI85_CUCMM|nr:lysine histidine transporter-like 8 [Cucumis melo var. makuwa]